MSCADVETLDISSSKQQTSDQIAKQDVCVLQTAEGIIDEKVHDAPLYNPHVDVSGVDERKLMRKVDWNLVPWLSFLFMLSFLDRTSVGNAKVSDTIQFGHTS